MQDEFINSLLRATSEPRLEPYLTPAGRVSTQAGIARYLWNLRLSESLYPALQGVEVTLRNSIHRVATENFSSDHWFNALLVAPETDVLENARKRLASQGKRANPDNLVSALSFGFWVNLFYRRYEQKLWPRLLKEVFPYIPVGMRRRNYISQRLNPIRDLRNRVFHYEPIWHWPDLAQHHQEALEVIGWINPELLALVQLVDRFPEVYAQGPERYFEELRRLGRGKT